MGRMKNGWYPMEDTYRCGHVVEGRMFYENGKWFPDTNRQHEWKICNRSVADALGLTHTEAMGFRHAGKFYDLVRIDNFNNCPECWKKAVEIKEDPKLNELWKMYYNMYMPRIFMAMSDGARFPALSTTSTTRTNNLW